MRYADAPTVSVEALVAAPPAVVWSLVTDINLPGRFSTEFQRAEWLDGAGPALGARFRGYNHHPAIGEWDTTSTVVVCEVGKVFGWAVGDQSHPSASWRFELKDEEGGTRLVQWAQIGPAPSGLTAAIEARPDKEERIVEHRLAEHRANMLATIEGIRALAERRAGRPEGRGAKTAGP